MLISYAQNFEDVMLWRALRHVENGFYIDIGAQDPVVDSVSLGFYEHGWRGVHVEPTPAYAQALREARADEVVVQAAIGDEGSLIPFYEIPNSGISTGDADIAQRHEGLGFTHKRIDVPCIRLSALLDKYHERDIHWMKIDVEGMELSVLRSWGPSPVRPWVVVIESTRPLSQELSHSAWEQIVLDLGYDFAYFDGLNRFYVSEQHRELLERLAFPPNVFDVFAMAGTGSHAFCALLNGALEQTKLKCHQLTLQRTELEAQAELARQDNSERVQASEADHLRHEAQAQQLAAALPQLEQARDEILQLLRHMSTKDDAHAAALAAAREDWAGLLKNLIEQEVLWREDRQHLELTRSEVRRLQAELARQNEEARTESARRENSLSMAVELALRESAQRELVVAGQVLKANEAAIAQLAEQTRAHASTLERVYAMQQEHAQVLASVTGALEAELRAEVEAARAEAQALRAQAAALAAELERMHGSFSWVLMKPLRRLASLMAYSGQAPGAKFAAGAGATTTVSERAATAGATPASHDPGSPWTPTQSMNLISTVTGPASSAEELLSLHDEDFVRCAYLTLLGRSPDPSGLTHYVGLLRNGVAKGRIVAGIARSPEGKGKAATLPGLRETMWQHRRRVPSLMGHLLRRVFATALEPLAMQIRSSENTVFRMHRESETRLARLESSTGELRTLLHSNKDALQRLTSGPRVRTPAHAPAPDVAPPARQIYYYVDHTIACPTNTGMQRVARRLGDALVKAGESVTFVKWDAERKQLALLTKDELRYLGQWNGPKLADSELRRYPYSSAGGNAVPMHAGVEPGWLVVPEVTHITYQAGPMTLDVLGAAKKMGLKTAFVFYDATPLRRPELQPMADAHATYMQQLMLADLVVPISNWVSADLSAFLRLDQSATVGPAPRIEPIPLPGESQLAARIKVAEESVGAAPYLLSVGSIVPHKNQVALIHAFDAYCRSNASTPWKLTLAGNLHPDLAEELSLISSKNPRIVYVGEVDDDRLVELYKGCSFTVFPSVMEGFGLPILESLWFGKPCICANFGAMAEVAIGGGCITVNTGDRNELSHAIGNLIGAPDRLATLAAEARGRHIESWHHYATTLLKKMDDLSSPLARLGHIYYWVDHTATYDGNTGIQRVTRALARSLQAQGAKLIPVRWSSERRTIISATTTDLQHLEKWNGPKVSLWCDWKPLGQVSQLDWLLVPEVTHFQTDEIRQFGRAAKLRCAWVFYDCIPSKMTDIYPPAATAAHRDYMMSLRTAEKVLAISEFSRDDLLDFLTATDARCGEISTRVAACVLPGEFLEIDRTTSPRQKRSSGTVRILSVGTVEPRKSHLTLLAAMKIVQANSHRNVELVIAGGAPYVDLADEVQKLVDSIPGAKWIRRVDDAGLQELYRSCDFTVYPSVEEGFGLPILESLWNARPCVCASFGAMKEVAEGGGCIALDVRDVKILANGILQLVDDIDLLEELGQEAATRQFKTWRDYGLEVLTQLADERAHVYSIGTASAITTIDDLHTEMPNIRPRPLLSICISTYNRAGWLSVSLKNLHRFLPDPLAEVELLVCDNTSTDATPSVVEPYLGRSDFTYVRNPENVGMLGNLRVTAHHARGKYVWILGDDDLVMQGTIQRVLTALRSHPETALLYLNYAYTRIDKAEEVEDLDRFLCESTPIGPTGPDEVGTVRDMCAQSENFFTAIYCLVFRRDHALRAYSQDTSGRPFSTMLTCIPTTYHVLNHMMDEPAYWLGQPQLVVNMNVSWMRYAPLWILERLPEAFDVAERYGGDPERIDRWRANLVPHVQHWMNDMVAADPEGNAEFVSFQRVVNRFKHLPEFRAIVGTVKQSYESAHRAGHAFAAIPTESVFSAFNQSQSSEAT